MRVSICGLSFRLTESIIYHVEACIEAALGHASDRVEQVMVRLDDINGPRGGQDKRCRIVVWLRDAGAVLADAAHRDLYAAVDLAAMKAGQKVFKRWSRKRTMHRAFVSRRDRRIPA